MALKPRQKGEPPPDYGADSDKFTFEVHHGGFFMGHDSNQTYVNGKVNWFDNLSARTWSLVWFEKLSFSLHYPKNPALNVWWLLPGRKMPEGLRMIVSERDTKVMAAIVDRVKLFVLYFDHDGSASFTDWDDVVINPVSSLPKVVSPSKVGKSQDNIVNIEADDNSNDDSDVSEFVDSDYELEEDDDTLFADNVDGDVRDRGVGRTKKIGKGTTGRTYEGKLVVVHGDSGSEQEDSTDEDVLQLPDSDGESNPSFIYESFKLEDMVNPVFKVGLMFESVQLLRQVVTEYSLRHRVDVKMPRNEKKRVTAICSKGKCSWKLHASYDDRFNAMVIKTYSARHNCQKKWVLKCCTSNWLAEKYIESFRADPKMSIANFARVVQKEWHLTPSRSKLARAKRLAMKQVSGDEEKQYKMLWDYAHELRKSNPCSSFFLNLDGNLFKSLYVSLGACKRGFLAACRPLICLDGCHLKTKYGGIMLAAVGIDPNDCIYPIAYAVVEVECLESWKWFLQTLKQDLDIQNTYPWTIMTDKQKGLIKAVAEVFPESEHRFCVRHMYSNFQKLFKGENLKNQLWACARSTTVVQFNKNMEKMRVLDEKAFKWLEKMPPNTWSRAFFSTYCKCDLLLNNSCEVFNNFILDAREMPVLTMLEQIKGQLMARHYSKEREPGQMWQGPICPKIRKKVNKIAQWANTCYPIPSGNGIFQVQDRDHTFIVDIELRTCECRRWDLTGIPCSHAISCLRHERIPIESKVHDCYSSARFLLAYGPKILPCSDPTTWEKIPGPDVQPPKYEKKVGRPIKNRRKQPIEIETTEGIRLSRHGVSMTCSYCGLSGHNRKGCALRKSGLQPQPNVASSSVEPREEDGSQDFENIYGEPPIFQMAMHYEEGTERPFAMLLGESQPPLSQLTGGSQPTFSQLVADTMISRLDAEASQAATRRVEPVSLPDSSFIISNLPAARPVPPSTATKTGKAALGKRKVEDTKKTKKTKKANDGRA